MTKSAVQRNQTLNPAHGRRSTPDSRLEAMVVRMVNRAARQRAAAAESQLTWLEGGPTLAQAGMNAAIVRDWLGEAVEGVR